MFGVGDGVMVGVCVGVGSGVEVSVWVGSSVGVDVSEVMGASIGGVALLSTVEVAPGAQLKRSATVTKNVRTKNSNLCVCILFPSSKHEELVSVLIAICE